MRETLELPSDATFGMTHLEIEPDAELPPGTIAKVRFPILMRLGAATADGRWFSQEGFSIEPLPLPISYKDTTTNEVGHHGARLAGSLRGTDISPDGIVSGWGYLADLPAGRECKTALETGSIRGTSADIRGCVLDQLQAESLGVNRAYASGSLAQVTIVPIPAFPDAFAELDRAMAITASATLIRDLRPPRDAFENPRLSKPTGIRVVPLNSEFNAVFGHFFLKNQPHIGLRKYTPAPLDDDFSYFYSGGTVLCDDGMEVPVGRIFIGNNHPNRRLLAQDALDNYCATSAAWADVRVGKDQWGGWFAGVTRPGISEELAYAGRASAVSGDWRPIKGRRRLIAILSGNTAGYPILEPGVASLSDDEIDEDDLALVASVPATLEDEVVDEVDGALEEAVADDIADAVTDPEIADEDAADLLDDVDLAVAPVLQFSVVRGHPLDPVRLAVGAGPEVEIHVKGYTRNGRWVRPSTRHVKAGSAAAKAAKKAGEVVTPVDPKAKDAENAKVGDYLRQLYSFLAKRGVDPSEIINKDGSTYGATSKAHAAWIAALKWSGAKIDVDPKGDGNASVNGSSIRLTAPRSTDGRTIFAKDGTTGDSKFQRVNAQGMLEPIPAPTRRRGKPSIATVIKRRVGQGIDAIDSIIND